MLRRNGARRILLSFVLLLLLILCIKLILDETNFIGQLKEVIEEAGPLAPIAYIALKAVLFVLAPLSSLPFQVTAGAAFGVFAGTIYTIIGATIGGCVNFLVARHLGRSAILWLIGSNGITKVDKYANHLTKWSVLFFVRVFLSPIYDFISYAAGLTRMPLHQYMIVSIIGGVIPTVLWVALGASLTANFITFLLTLGGIGLLYAVMFALRKKATKLVDDAPKDDI